MTWTSHRVHTGIVHTVPDRDLVEHERSEDCPCGPHTERLVGDDGSDSWHHQHHSLDGREHHEG